MRRIRSSLAKFAKIRIVSLFQKLLLLSLPFIFASFSFPGIAHAAWRPDEGSELIGTKAPELKDLTWLNSPALTLAQLSGKVVLIRFWLIDCPYCQHTAPTLNYFLDKYGKSGLVVLGIHHPKSIEAKNKQLVLKGMAELNFTFPVAMDNNWTNVNAYWLAKKERRYTSASFLIDKHGLIRWVHPGGDIILKADDRTGKSAFSSLDQKIKQLIEEK